MDRGLAFGSKLLSDGNDDDDAGGRTFAYAFFVTPVQGRLQDDFTATYQRYVFTSTNYQIDEVVTRTIGSITTRSSPECCRFDTTTRMRSNSGRPAHG